MTSGIGGSYELQILFCAIVLGLLQLAIATIASVSGRGFGWGIGTRDDGWPALGRLGGRLERAFKNFIETFPFFLGAVLLANALGRSTHTSQLGADIYIWARFLYVPLYVFGIPFTRTLAWAASMTGIVMVLAAVWPGI